MKTRHKVNLRKSRKRKYGGTLNFNVYNLAPTNLYHGTFNKITTDLITPYFLSMDPLQSIGHLLIEFRTLFKEQSKPTNTLTITNKLKLMRNCFPTLYVYTSPQLRLLQIKNPSDFKNSFDILFNKPVLHHYVNLMKNADEIKKMFMHKIDALGAFKLPPIADLDSKFKHYLDKWTGYCSSTCFAGWANTPGYLLLSKIDYNAYFKELELIHEDVTGIYVNNDQDEIIMFEQLNRVNKIPVFPYDVLNSSADVQLDFIEKYTNLPDRNFMNQCVKPYNYFMDNIRWDFGFFKTKCVTYNPYKPIAKQLMLNKTENCKSTCRISTSSSDDIRYLDPKNKPCFDPVDHYPDDDNPVIPSDYTSVKYSIFREDNLYYLSMYIQKIVTTVYSSAIIDALDKCSRAPVLDRHLHNQLNA